MTATIVSLRAPAATTNDPWSDEGVAAACATGDPKAIAELFDRYEVPVTRFLSRLLGGTEVEDLVQSTFLEVVGQRARYDGRSSVKTWLFAIATNMVRRHRRTSARRWRLVWTLSNVEPRMDEELSTQIDARRDIERVRAAFMSLSEKVRVAFVLCELEGFSAKEAGQVLGTNEVTIWKRVSDARKALVRASMEGQK